MIAPERVAVPDVVGDVSVAVYVPLPAYDTAARVPDVAAIVTVAAFVAIAFPYASFNVTVTTAVVEPSATRLDGDTDNVDVAADGDPDRIENAFDVPDSAPPVRVTVID